MRYLVTIELIDETLHSFNIWILSKNLFVVEGRAKFSVLAINTLLVSLSQSVQFGNLYRKLDSRDWRNSMNKKPHSTRMNFFNFFFCGGKTRFTYTTAANKRTNFHFPISLSPLSTFSEHPGRQRKHRGKCEAVKGDWVSNTIWRKSCHQLVI